MQFPLIPHKTNDTPLDLISDAEVDRCQDVIHRNVGESAELSSCLQNETVSSVRWKHGEDPIADKDRNYTASQYKSRLLFHRNFNLIILNLTLQDSGVFTFVSKNSEGTVQRKTIQVILHVHGKSVGISL